MPNTYKMSTYLEQAILNEVLRGQNYLPPSNIHVGLFTSDPTDEDIGTEVSGGGYARQAVTFGAPVKDGNNKSVVHNTNEIDFGIAASDWGNISYFGIFDAASGGNLLFHGELTNPKTILENDRPIWYAGDLKIRLG